MVPMGTLSVFMLILRNPPRETGDIVGVYRMSHKWHLLTHVSFGGLPVFTVGINDNFGQNVGQGYQVMVYCHTMARNIGNLKYYC